MAGLVRGMVRTAAVVGTATATRNAINRRQAARNMQAYSDAVDTTYAQPAPTAAPPPESADDGVIERLERLGALKAQGILTEAEFSSEKARILAA